jgi:DNA-binding response OmpR family regulator
VRILIVEDEPGLRSYLVPLFEREGFAADVVRDPDNCLVRGG